MLELWIDNLGVCAGVLVALAVILAALHRIECRVSSYLARRVGWRASLVPTGVIGVPLHELSHLIAARLFGHRVIGYSLFAPDPTTGTLGYVRYAYRRRSAWQLCGTFFVGVAPFVAGSLALTALGVSMVSEPAQLAARLLATDDVADLVSTCARAARSLELSPWLPLQAYLAAAVASHMAPSPRDLRGGLPGAAVLAALLATVVTLASAVEISLAAAGALVAPVAVFALLAAVLQLAYAAMVALITRGGRARGTALRLGTRATQERTTFSSLRVRPTSGPRAKGCATTRCGRLRRRSFR